MIAPKAPKSANAKQMVHKLMQQSNQLTRRHSSSWLVGLTDEELDRENGKELRKIGKLLDQKYRAEEDELEFSRYRKLQTKRYSIDLAKVNNKHKLLAKEQRITVSELTRQEEEQSRNKEFRMDLSFSGAGFMGCYYFGVVNCWNKYIPRERVRRVAGASAGALIAAYYLMDLALEEALREIIKMLEDIRRRPLGVFDRSNQIVDILPVSLDRLFAEDAHKRVNGRLFVSMTRLKDMKNVIVNEFESKQDLIDALNCSCFIPVWSGSRVPTFRGVKHIDGGFTNNLPVFDEHTIRVCCFSGASDIAPSDGARMEILQGSLQGMPFHWSWANVRRAGRALWPPPPAYVVAMLERGFHDAKDFILTNDLIQCESCFASMELAEQPVFAQRTPTISPGATPAMSRATSFRDLASLGSQQGRRTPSAAGLAAGRQIGEGAAPAEGKKAAASFGALLRAKLGRVASAAELRGPAPAAAGAHSPPSGVPQIVVDSDSGCEADTGAPAQPQPLKLAKLAYRRRSSQALGSPSERFIGGAAAQRRNTRAQLDTSRLQLDLAALQANLQQQQQQPVGKFSLVPEPLPSCPPSPNLNRHCSACIRMRQEARADMVDEVIRDQAQKYRQLAANQHHAKGAAAPAGGPDDSAKASRVRKHLSSPLRWVRQQLASRESYSFGEPDAPNEPKAERRRFEAVVETVAY